MGRRAGSGPNAGASATSGLQSPFAGDPAGRVDFPMVKKSGWCAAFGYILSETSPFRQQALSQPVCNCFT